MSNFVKDLRNSKFLKYLLEGHEVILAYVTGSRVLDLTDEYSDYDVIIVCADNKLDTRDTAFKYEGQYVHWYYYTLTEWLEMTKTPLDSIGRVYYLAIDDGHKIYQNPNYPHVLSLMESSKYLIGYHGAIQFYYNNIGLVEHIVREHTVPDECKTKRVSYLVQMTYILNQEQIDEETKAKLINLKRIRYQDVPESTKEWAYERIILLKTIIERLEAEYGKV